MAAKKAKTAKPKRDEPKKLTYEELLDLLRECPLCGRMPKMYRLADYGQIRCWPCGLRLEVKGGMEAAITRWNNRMDE